MTRAHWSAVAAVLLALPTGVLAQERTWEGRWETHPLAWPFVVLVAGLVLLILLGWALLQFLPLILGIVGAVAGIRWLSRAADRSADPAVSVLRERYARGEIGKEEFEAKMRDLMR